mgnify:CR=1 FL=1
MVSTVLLKGWCCTTGCNQSGYCSSGMPVSLSIAGVTVAEGDTGSVNAAFEVTLSAASGRNVTVNYQTSDGGAPSTVPDGKGRSRPPLFAPGERNQYCNGCYIALGAIVEKVSGMPYEKYVADNVFGGSRYAVKGAGARAGPSCAGLGAAGGVGGVRERRP